MGDVDPAFVQATEHRPKLAFVEAEGIPVIDLSSISNSHQPSSSNPAAAAIEPLVAEIGEACKKWGFFQVINHGVPSERLQKLELASKEFFAQSKEEKRKVAKDQENPLGYNDAEHTKNVRDWREVLDLTLKEPTVIPASPMPHNNELKVLVNRWPDYPPDLREAVEEYVEVMEELCNKLLGLISLSLGLRENRLSSFFNNHTGYIRLNHYPSCPSPHLALGLGRHKDNGAVTILAQDDVGGLEVKRKTDGEWVRVKPTSDAYIVNIGDNVQVWSNDKYESVEHRVAVNSEKERFSIAFFLKPDHDVMVEPLEELISEENPAKYRPYNWGKFLANRLQSNLKKLDVENIQISHFRIQVQPQ